jgi:long-subunit acyl-CoA synthetase (AMP-forming)
VEAKIVDRTSERILPRGEKGELYTRGYIVMKGYWGDIEATNKSITSDGWMRTGITIS